MKNFQILLLAVVLIFTACRKDKEIPGVDFVPTGGTEMIKSRLTGQVIDQAGLPVEGANVKFEQSETVTNEDGVFTFAAMDLQMDGQVISVEKTGFFTNFKKIIPTKNQTFQKIGLIEKSGPTGTFKATEGGTISKLNGEKIIFKPNSILSESTDDYRGEVTVYTHHFNPESSYFGETMPGDLSAVRKSGEPVQLATYSMVLVELYGEVGQKLNLKPNTTATVEFPIKGAAAASAPETIPLWWLDENTGTWVEEFQATKEGDYYVGEVSHFSFWNCDDPFDVVNLSGTVLDTDGNPIPYITVSLEIVNGGAVRSCNANHEGEFGGGVPKNEELVLKIINYCAEVVHTETIGPFTSDQDITVTIDQSQNMLMISGKVLDCNSNPVADGYVVVNTTAGVRTVLPIDASGDFSSTLFVCQSAQLTVYGVDNTAGLKTPEVTINFTGQDSEILGTLTACDTLDEFVTMTLEGNDYSLENLFVMYRPGFMSIASTTSDRWFSVKIPNPVIGANTPIELNLGDDNAGLYYYCNEDIAGVLCTGNMTVNITRLDNYAGGYIEGICTGNLWKFGTTLETVTIRFKAKTDQLMIPVNGRVWDDLNKNGLQDAGEPGAGNITLAFSGSVGGALYHRDTTVTQADGSYQLAMSVVESGTLIISDLPPNYVVSLQDQGTDDTIDSDFTSSSRRINNVIAIEGANNQFDCGVHEN